MKKLIIIFSLCFLLSVPVFVGADTNSYTALQKAQMIQILTQEIAQLQAQLNAILAQQANNASNIQQQTQTAAQQLNQANEISQLLTIGNTLQDYYNKIRAAKDLGSLWCNFSSQCEVNLAANLAKNALGENSFANNPPPDQDAIYHTLTGSYSYVDAKKQLDNLVFATYAAGVNLSTDSDSIKIQKILGFIDSNIQYEHDMQETPRAPAETLGLKSGDCKSYSILASAALADAGINSAVAYGTVSDGGHAMILVQSNDTLPLSEFYSDLTYLGLPSGKWWLIEPQYTLAEQQQNPEWFAQWTIKKVALVSDVK